MKIIIIISTNGGILKKLCNYRKFSNYIAEIVSDRNCGAIKFAKKNKIPFFVYKTNSSLEFSNFIYSRYKNIKIDLFVSFYTKIISGKFLLFYKNKIINLHPTLLPSFSGLKGFERNVFSKYFFMGSTLHLIDEGIDTGVPVMQFSIPINKNYKLKKNREIIFYSQCLMLLQFLKWFIEKRIYIKKNNQIKFKKINFLPSFFSPNLDKDLMLFWKKN